MNLIDKSFVRDPKHYLLQSLLAVVVIVVIFYFEVLPHIIIAISLGGSAFVVFTMPARATTRKLVGGHIIGLICGSIFYFLFFTGPLAELAANERLITILAYALAVGLCIFLMTITNTEHTPAVSTALGIVSDGWSYQVVLSVLLFAVTLAIIRKLLHSRLRDLT
ncbi:HPP family protein [Chloroflexota bacterium]